MDCPVVDNFLTGRPRYFCRGAKDFEASSWPHGPVANFPNRDNLSASGLEARLKAFNQGLIDCFEDEVGSLAD